jgi:hypothetical protein
VLAVYNHATLTRWRSGVRVPTSLPFRQQLPSIARRSRSCLCRCLCRNPRFCPHNDRASIAKSVLRASRQTKRDGYSTCASSCSAFRVWLFSVPRDFPYSSTASLSANLASSSRCRTMRQRPHFVSTPGRDESVAGSVTFAFAAATSRSSAASSTRPRRTRRQLKCRVKMHTSIEVTAVPVAGRILRPRFETWIFVKSTAKKHCSGEQKDLQLKARRGNADGNRLAERPRLDDVQEGIGRGKQSVLDGSFSDQASSRTSLSDLSEAPRISFPTAGLDGHCEQGVLTSPDATSPHD